MDRAIEGKTKGERVKTRNSIFLFATFLVSLGFLMPLSGEAQIRSAYIELDALIVEGQIQRPQAVYIIQRASLDFGAQAKRKSFVHKIKDSIFEDPF